VAELDWPAGEVDAFVHGERGAVKELRDVLFKDHGLHRKQVSISGYWAYGRAEDAFQAEKKTPAGQIFPENYPGERRRFRRRPSLDPRLRVRGCAR
jgi:hypothetical protein